MKILFDAAHNPEQPTLILAYRDGRKLGEIIHSETMATGSMMNPNELSFKVYKWIDLKKNPLWDKIVDFKLVWYKEIDTWFEAKVELDEATETIKQVSCVQLGQAETGQIMLYDIEINTENDIARDDYIIPTVLWNPEHPEASLLHRIMEKAAHYSIIHVDPTIANIQRTFTFSDISLYDAFMQIAEEIGCIFVFHSDSDENGKIRRTISVYDLQSNCLECGHRGEFTMRCPKCQSKQINEGYGEDTNIFVTADELAESIQFVSNTDAIKNCFKLVAGDDLMTATIRNCNPNGTDYLWYFSDDMKSDMSDSLRAKIEQYDQMVDHYQNEYEVPVQPTLLQRYNELVEKYRQYNEDLEMIETPVVGYASLMNAVYDTIDFALYLESGLMPDASMQDTNAQSEAEKLTAENLSPVAVTDTSKASISTCNNAVLSVAKTIIDSRYKVKVNDATLSGLVWTGNFVITNNSDEEDTCVSSTISIQISDDYLTYIRQKLDKAIKDEETQDMSLTGLFELEYDPFCKELKKYSLKRLESFLGAAQACIDIMIEQGVGSDTTWADSETLGTNLYDELYMPYYNRLSAVEAEMTVRTNEIGIIEGVYDIDGTLITDGLQSSLNQEKVKIQNELNMQKYLGDELWLELCTYRRDDKFENGNFISDGLNNSELFGKSLEFIEVAQNEIYKSAELQHSITGNLKNLLLNKKFMSLLGKFETGNWLRVRVDDKVYKLRLLDYSINFGSLESLDVEFSDVLKTANGVTDQQSLMTKIVSMATTYDTVQRQANQSEKTNQTMDQWLNDGFSATNTKIVGASNQSQVWDSHGMLFREYDPLSGGYSPEQMKIINSTMAMTNDNWKNTKTAVGKFYYRDPETNELVSAYGLNGEAIVGKLFVGESLGLYNKSGSMKFNNDGLNVSNSKNTFAVNPNNEDALVNIKHGDNNILTFDANGELLIVGNITARSLTLLDGAVTNNKTTGLHDLAVSGSWNDLDDIPNFANISLSGSYNDLVDVPNFASVAYSGSYNDLVNTPNLATVATSGKYSDLSGTPTIATVVQSSGSNPVSGQAVYNYSVAKNQGTSNAGKVLYVNSSGVVTTISISELKSLLG